MKRIIATAILAFSWLLSAGQDKDFYHIVVTPGEDASTSVTINYHTNHLYSYIQYADVLDISCTRYQFIKPVCELWSTKDIENTSTSSSFYTNDRFVCHATITDLQPGRKYEFWICCSASGYFAYAEGSGSTASRTGSHVEAFHPEVDSETCYFTTASNSKEWNFVAFTDFQSVPNSITHQLIRNMKEIGNNPPLMVCSGDMVDVAGWEDSWTWLLDNDAFRDFVYASSPGDHAYWADAKDRKYPQYTEAHTFNHLFHFPQNGAEKSKNTSYFFYYNNALFVSLDMNNSNISRGEKFDDQARWFQHTLDSLKGTYQYLIVLMHKSVYGSSIIDSNVGKYIRPQWSPIFQKYNVDLVLSGHDHVYSRTYQLDGDHKSTIKNKGTYYLDMGSSGNKRRAVDTSLSESDGIHAKVIDLKTKELSFAANIQVSKKKMIVTVYNQHKQIADQFTIKAKRR